jgi:hypothetical protein
MQGAPLAEDAAWVDQSRLAVPTIGWFVRRSALWAGIVIAAVALACAFYSIASGFEDVHAAPQQAQGPLKV